LTDAEEFCDRAVKVWRDAPREKHINALETRKRALGENIPSLRLAWATIASTYAEQRRWNEAGVLEV